MMTRKSIFIANWKMNLSNESIETYVKEIKNIKNNNSDIIIAVPYPYLFQARNIVSNLGSDICIAAQNVCYKEGGAYTGEVSVKMLKDLNISHIILGHSERRHIFNESNQYILEKVKLAYKHELNMILCIGETIQERNEEKTFEILLNQLSVLKNIPDLTLITIAYEPVWAIGTGVSALPSQVQEVHAFIRKWVSNIFGVNTANSVSIIYGGSINPENISNITSQSDVDGGLVGSASLKCETFSRIIINSNKKQ